MKLKILQIRLAIVYKLATFTNRLSSWLCDEYTELHLEWKEEFSSYEED